MAPAERGGSALPIITPVAQEVPRFPSAPGGNPDRKGRRQDPTEERNAVLKRYREECQKAVKNADRLRLCSVSSAPTQGLAFKEREKYQNCINRNTGDSTGSPF